MNGWTPTPTNKERKDYDFERALLFEARAIAYDVASQHPITKDDEEKFLDFVEVCLTHPSTMKIVTVTKSENAVIINGVASEGWFDAQPEVEF